MNTAEIKTKGFYVYKGFCKKTNELQYIGTTIQIPKDRFRWHKSNGKDLKFEVVAVCENSDDMLQMEFDLINLHKPILNIKTKKQNFNKKLTQQELENRKTDKQWCSSCLKRRVNVGFKKCYYCK